MLGGGALCVRLSDARQVTAIRVTAAVEALPVAVPVAVPVVAPVAAADKEPAATARISLYELVSQLRSAPSTSTTRPTTTTTARPITVPSSTTTTTALVASSAKAPLPTSTTVTTTPLTPLTTLVQGIAPIANAVLGQASWFNAPDGTCAHRDLPFGTVVKVTRTSTGVSTTCRVNDRGPTLATNRIIDLSLDTFEKLAASEAGVITVKIEW